MGALGLGAVAFSGGVVENVRSKGTNEDRQGVNAHALRILVADAQQQRRLAEATADVQVGFPQAERVGMVLDDLLPARRQFDAEPHYLLAAASYLRDEGVLDEDFELAAKLGIAIGDAALVLRNGRDVDRTKVLNGNALVSGFYPGAESDPHSRAFLVKALEVMQAAVAELRDDDALVILAR